MIKCVSPHHAVREYMHTPDATQTPLTNPTLAYIHTAQSCQTLFVKKSRTQFPQASGTAVAPLSHAQMLLSGTFLQARKIVHKHRRKCFADILQVCGPVVGTYDKYMLHMVQIIFLQKY